MACCSTKPIATGAGSPYIRVLAGSQEQEIGVRLSFVAVDADHDVDRHMAHWCYRVDRAVRLTPLADRFPSYIAKTISIRHRILGKTLGQGVTLPRVGGMTVSGKQLADLIEILKF
jgi:hypothetical protein